MTQEEKDELELRAALEPCWFRIEARYWSVSDEWGQHTNSGIVLIRIPVAKHTPKGAWLGKGVKPRFVLREYEHRGRAYAAPTEQQAIADFQRRKAFQIRMHEKQISRATLELDLLNRGRIRALG